MSVQDIVISHNPNHMFATRYLEDVGSWFLCWRYQFEQLIRARGGEPASHLQFSTRQQKIEAYQREMAEKITLAPARPQSPEDQPQFTPEQVLPDTLGGITELEQEDLMRLLDEGFE